VAVWKVQCLRQSQFLCSAEQKQGKTWRTANVSTVQEIDTGVTENGIEGKVGWL
jgi:hypothetical protein